MIPAHKRRRLLTCCAKCLGGMPVTSMLWVDHFGHSTAAAYFSGCDGGVSRPPYASLNVGLHVGDDAARVLENRRLVARSLGVRAGRVTYAEQVHGAGVAVVGRRETGAGAKRVQDAIGGVDALVTRERDVTLAVLAADCVPILLADPEAGVIGAAHAGWRGVTTGVAGAAIRAMTELGARADRVQAALGPAIRGCCYEVDAPVLDAIRHTYAAMGVPEPVWTVSARDAGRRMLDLIRVCTDQLTSQGVRADAIVDVSVCTHCMPGFFSHRRSGGRTGRHAGYVVLL